MGRLHNVAGVYGKFKAQSCPEHQLKLVKEAIDRGHDVNERNSYGNTPAYLSARGRNLKVTAALVKAGADLNIRNKFGVCAMDFIEENDDYDALVELGVDMEAHRRRSIRNQEERRKHARVLDVITIDEDSNQDSTKQEEEEENQHAESRKRRRIDLGEESGATNPADTSKEDNNSDQDSQEGNFNDNITKNDEVKEEDQSSEEENFADDENEEPSEYLIRLKKKDVLKDDFTKKLIRNSFCNESDISTTSITVALKCPLSKKMMKYPCRSTGCSPQHLQMFDAASFFEINANQRKDGQWLCPVCDQPVKFEHLALDGYFTKIIRDIRGKDIIEVGVRVDGSWYPVEQWANQQGFLRVTESPLKEINMGTEGNSANRGQPANVFQFTRVKSEDESD